MTKEDDGPSDEQPQEEVCPAAAHLDKFDPLAYLESFYKTASEDEAMQVVLFFLPGMIYRLPPTITTALDLGAGPTVYLPIVLRQRALEIFTSDYAKLNRDVLQSWIEDKSVFDWSNVCKWIANIEASEESPSVMQQEAREKVKAVLEVDVQKSPVIQKVHWQREGSNIPEKFQLVSTVFCLEYSCETLEGYRQAVRGACSLIEDGGYLLQGGVTDATTYNFGGKVFKCHRLQRSHIEDSLKENGMAITSEDGYKFITHDDIFLLISKKVR
uniref:Methyltransferase domain containing protein n=2 Tax=Haemonchus contortus TaxID=6289 RepID=A0A7I4YG48_HAECO